MPAFPDRHSDLTVQLIEQVRQLFGQQGLDKLISAREQASEVAYGAALRKAQDVGAACGRAGPGARAGRLHGRSAAAGRRQPAAGGEPLPHLRRRHRLPGFCRSELALFQRALGEGSRVERAEHLLAGGRRCVYKITPV